ncbi:exo-rhamnogalacturonan lyase family protein [Paenibacillus glycanilyticus]|uniref:exo-rhamnogalacturonan lyase family protein n=1 Tax=Paenibacillus glycanilyticus TaxID=126569 RepID=UPI00190FE1F0
MAAKIQLHSLSSNQSIMPVGMTWGIPWKEGELGRDEALSLTTSLGVPVPMQHWATAFWPDGSVKWSAHAAVSADSGAEAYSLTKGEAAAAPLSVKVTETNDEVRLDTGVIVCTLGKQGSSWLRGITRNGVELCSGGELVCIRESASEVPGVRTVRQEPFESRVHRLTIEQEGPVRAVVKIDGRHRAAAGSREWLPFSMRLYLYAGLETIRIVHTFFYDGNPNEDFIKGLGIRFAVPMRGEQYNRHIRFSGDNGLFAESPKTLHTRRTKGKYRELFERQTAGAKVGFDPSDDAYFLGLLDDSATWDGFKLMQQSSEHYRIWKRTGEGCSWVKVTDGHRAGGLAFVGSEGGGLACGLRQFWRKHPSGFEVHGAAGDEASFTAWLWTPEGEPMDMRHYDTKTHVESSYEGAEELRATPYGIANTNELMLWCTEETPGPELLESMRLETDNPSLLVCEPSYYHEAGAFGIWSLPDHSTEEKRQLEARLDGIIAFYRKEVEQRKWYGLWDYGDYMHSYDPVRHVWNYDLGGCAWQNTELAPNMWLWIMFLRTGREDIFRMAEAMTRHTSEVDVYHFGEYAGLGSRHNVVHWGCGCKEARIGMAGLHRYFYYLTADERIGDMMNETKDSDFTTVNLDPMRYYFPKDEHPTHIRVGPDWAAFSSNWMTQWERYESAAYRDKILVGINCIKGANYRLISGPTYGYDPKTGVLTPMGDDNWGRHLAICMGGPQVWFELASMLKDPEWEEMLAELGVYYNKTQEEKDKLTKGQISTTRFEHPVLSAAIVAYGAYYRKDEATARQCWDILLGNPFAAVNLQEEAATVAHLDVLQEIDWMNTNEAAQWSLNTIIALELIAEHLPKLREQSLQELT